MNKRHEKIMTDLDRLVEGQQFKTIADLQKFLDGFIGKQIPSLPKEALNNKEQAQDLVFEAYELSLPAGKIKAEQALQLDPDCIEAYEYLGNNERTPDLAMLFYEKGIAIGRRLYGGAFLQENKGFFWGIHETRPFMRCMYQYADCLYALEKIKECVSVFEEMIELNPNDNQGVRDQLLLYLIELEEDTKFEHYAKLYEGSGSAFALFNRALFAFKKKGDTAPANKKLKEAINQNKFVANRLLSAKPTTGMPDFYGWGDEDEAKHYAFYAQHIWRKTMGAIEWLRKHAKK